MAGGDSLRGAWHHRGHTESGIRSDTRTSPGRIRRGRGGERVVGDYETLRHAPQAIVEQPRALGSPIVWPVGEAADRLTGAATLLGAGEVRTRGWTVELDGERVLLLAFADVTTLALQQAGATPAISGP